MAVRNGSLQLGALHAQGAGSLGMCEWKVEDASPVSFAGSIRNAPAAELMAMAEIENVPVEGTSARKGRSRGPLAIRASRRTVTAIKGAARGGAIRPLHRYAGLLRHNAELAHGQLAAGGKSITIEARYQHQPGNFGRRPTEFQVDSNAMPLDQFRIVSKEYPGIAGTAELHSAAVAEIAPAKPGQPSLRLISLDGTLAGRGLRINDQTLRDGTLTATTKGTELTAHFDSEVAGSVIQGDGKWSLTDDYPGSVQLSFNRLDLERLRLWLRGRQPPGGMQVAGSVEGTLAIAGPALKPDLWKAQLRIPSLEAGPGAKLAPAGNPLALHNAAPIVVSMERGVVKVETARLVGRATDLSLTGTVNLQQKNALDLRVNGRLRPGQPAGSQPGCLRHGHYRNRRHHTRPVGATADRGPYGYQGRHAQPGRAAGGGIEDQRRDPVRRQPRHDTELVGRKRRREGDAIRVRGLRR